MPTPVAAGQECEFAPYSAGGQVRFGTWHSAWLASDWDAYALVAKSGLQGAT
jgi:hypothetical protein